MNKLKSLIESNGLNYKKQIIIFVILNVALIGGGVTFYTFINNPIIIAFFIFIIVLMDYIYLSRYKSFQKAKEKQYLLSFASLLPFFKTYIENGYTVYQSFIQLCDFANGELLERIQNLISDIDNDKTIKPFIDFSKHFNSLQIEQLMICIYQMIDEGSDVNHLHQFQMLFDKVRNQMLKIAAENKFNSLTNMSIFPLIGSAILIVMITFGVIAVIGASINGI